MKRLVPRLMHCVVFAIGLWWLSLTLLYIFPHFLPGVSGDAMLLSLPVVVVLLLLSLISLIRERNKLLSMVSLALIVLLFYVGVSRLMRWGALAHFYLNKAAYEQTARQVFAAHDDAERKRICGEVCWLPSSNPKRVAFHYVQGFLHWHDIIYDPTGAIDQLKTREERQTMGFYFSDAEHLTGDW